MTVCSSVNQNEDDLISCVQYLIKFGANVNSRDKNGNSCLIYAVKSGKCGIVSELIENNAEINDINKEKWSVSLNDYIFFFLLFINL
jgi:ankyrin repeat protein